MTVKELISELMKFSGNLRVEVFEDKIWGTSNPIRLIAGDSLKYTDAFFVYLGDVKDKTEEFLIGEARSQNNLNKIIENGGSIISRHNFGEYRVFLQGKKYPFVPSIRYYEYLNLTVRDLIIVLLSTNNMQAEVVYRTCTNVEDYMLAIKNVELFEDTDEEEIFVMINCGKPIVDIIIEDSIEGGYSVP